MATPPPNSQGKNTIIDPTKVWHRKNYLDKGKSLILAYHDGVITASLFIDEIVEATMKLACALEREKDVEFITTFTADDTMETGSGSSSDNPYDCIEL